MSGLRSFGGEFRKAQKVSLVGRSRGEETRAEVLERTRRERERRNCCKIFKRSRPHQVGCCLPVLFVEANRTGVSPCFGVEM